MTRFPAAGPRILIIGAGYESLGSAIREECVGLDLDPTTAGIQGEAYSLDVRDHENVRWVMRDVSPDHVIYTAGYNGHDWQKSMEVNVFGAMRCLDLWRLHGAPDGGHFVGISSNSAHIARTGSGAYCASKAAFSMALRCAARDVGRMQAQPKPIIYGYEPGLLMGTPMTQETEKRFPDAPLTRMLDVPDGIDPADLARMIASNLSGWRELNGVMLRIDNGEQ